MIKLVKQLQLVKTANMNPSTQRYRQQKTKNYLVLFDINIVA